MAKVKNGKTKGTKSTAKPAASGGNGSPAIDIGISAGDRKKIAEGLSRFLSDSFTLYLKTHNFHWNITGPMFNSLHVMFEGQYTEQWNALDETAERIRALGFNAPGSYAEFGDLASHLRYAERASRKLARSTFYLMGRYQARMEQKGALLGRIVDIGSEIFAISAACTYASTLAQQQPERKAEFFELAALFCQQARRRAEVKFEELWHNDDDKQYAVAQQLIEGRYEFWTVNPGSVDGEAPFYAVAVFARGLPDKLMTRIYLPDDQEKLDAWDDVKSDYQVDPEGEPVPNSTDTGRPDDSAVDEEELED